MVEHQNLGSATMPMGTTQWTLAPDLSNVPYLVTADPVDSSRFDYFVTEFDPNDGSSLVRAIDAEGRERARYLDTGVAFASATGGFITGGSAPGSWARLGAPEGEFDWEFVPDSPYQAVVQSPVGTIFGVGIGFVDRIDGHTGQRWSRTRLPRGASWNIYNDCDYGAIFGGETDAQNGTPVVDSLGQFRMAFTVTTSRVTYHRVGIESGGYECRNTAQRESMVQVLTLGAEGGGGIGALEATTDLNVQSLQLNEALVDGDGGFRISVSKIMIDQTATTYGYYLNGNAAS